MAVEVTLEEAVGGYAEFERAGGGVFDDGYAVLLDEGEDAAGPLMPVDVVADGGDGGAGPLGGGEQGEGLRRGTGGAVVVGDAMPVACGTQVLAQQLAGVGVEEADVDLVPLHVDAAADPAGRRRLAGRGDLDVAIQMHGAAAVLVVAKRFERQRA